MKHGWTRLSQQGHVRIQRGPAAVGAALTALFACLIFAAELRSSFFHSRGIAATIACLLIVLFAANFNGWLAGVVVTAMLAPGLIRIYVNRELTTQSLAASIIGYFVFSTLAVALVYSKDRSFERAQRLAEQLSRKDQALDLALKAGAMHSWEWTFARGTIEWSEGAEAVHGTALPANDKKITDRYLEIVHPDDRKALAGGVNEAIKSGRSLVCRYRIIRPLDKAVCWLEIRGDFVRNEALGAFSLGAVRGRGLERAYGVIIDVTADQLAREEINASHQLFRSQAVELQTILRSTTEGIIARIKSDNRIYANQAASGILQIASEEDLRSRLGSVHGDIVHLLADGSRCTDKSCPIERCERERKTVRSQPGESFIRKDGSTFPVSYSADPILSEEGVVLGRVISFRDMSEQLAFEERLAQSERLETVARLAGGIAHDFNNVMTVVRAASDLIKSEVSEESAAWWEAHEIAKAVDSAQSMTRQLLTFSRTHKTANPQPLDLRDLIQDSSEFLKRIVGEEVRLSIDLPEQLPAVVADPNLLRQILINLVLNAHESLLDPGVGEIAVVLASKRYRASELSRRSVISPPPSSGRYVVLCVSDTGAGIPQGIRRKIFDPFFTTKEHASGLGLATTYGAIREAGGTILVSSNRKGTTFKVLLPASDLPASKERTNGDQPPHGTERILFVEDNPGIRLLTETLLRRLGYTVITYGSPVEAAEKEATGSYHLLLSDVVMPGISGVTLARRLRAARPELKVLLISGYTKNEAIASIVGEAGVSFLEKPFSEQQLARAVRDLLDR